MNILLATDFSQNSWDAILTALKLYAQKNCRFYLFHSYEPELRNIAGARSSVRAGMVMESLTEVSDTRLAATLEDIKKVHANPLHTFEILSVSGDIIEALNRTLVEKEIELVVIGTTGVTGAKAIFMGRTAVRIVRQVESCPVLAVPRNASFQSLDKIVYPTEFAYHYQKETLFPIEELLKLWPAEICIFHVAQEFSLSDKQQRNREALKRRLGKYNYSFFKVAVKSTVASAITQFAEEKEAQLIAMVKHQHTLLEMFIEEPVIKKVSLNTTIPILVLQQT